MAKTRAIGTIERRIARATGQYPDIAAVILADLSNMIIAWAQYHPGWGRSILSEYRRHPKLEPFITALEDVPLPDGDNKRPPPNAGEMIFKHLPLVRKYAKQRATILSDDRGFIEVDDSLYSDLEGVGMGVLEAAVDRYDPTRGVTFGAFVRKRMAGAMDDWLRHERIRYATDGYAARALERNDAALSAPKRHRTSTGGYRETTYVETAVQPLRRPDGVPVTRLIRANSNMTQDIEAALERLNPRQREVYRGRVLSDPPVSSSVLAAQLGIRDDRQIRRIEKQAWAKMRRFLKVSPL